MTLGGNSRIKTMFHKQERVLVHELLECYKTQIRDVQRLDDDFKQSYRWTELNAKIEVLEKLLGKR